MEMHKKDTLSCSGDMSKWESMALYEKFEHVVSILLTLVISFVIVVALNV